MRKGTQRVGARVCAPVSQNTPQYSSEKRGCQLRAKSSFRDVQHWQELARRHLSQYSLPKWSKPCSPETMRIWLKHLEVTETDYEHRTATSLQEYIELNPMWPLRAWIGTLLELVEDTNEGTT